MITGSAARAIDTSSTEEGCVQLGRATRRVAERTSVGSSGGSHGADERRPRRTRAASRSDVAGAVHAFAEAALALPVDRLADVQVLAAEATGARGACIYIADYAQQVLQPLRGYAGISDPGRRLDPGARVPDPATPTSARDASPSPWSTVATAWASSSTATRTTPPARSSLAEAVGDALLLVLVSKRRYTDLILRARRAQPLTTAAEMQWDLLPPLACRASGASIAGILEPAYSTGGDSFDFAVNGDLLEFIVIDAVGHGMPAVLKSIAAITTYRNVRREQWRPRRRLRRDRTRHDRSVRASASTSPA